MTGVQTCALPILRGSCNLNTRCERKVAPAGRGACAAAPPGEGLRGGAGRPAVSGAEQGQDGRGRADHPEDPHHRRERRGQVQVRRLCGPCRGWRGPFRLGGRCALGRGGNGKRRRPGAARAGAASARGLRASPLRGPAAPRPRRPAARSTASARPGSLDRFVSCRTQRKTVPRPPPGRRFAVEEPRARRAGLGPSPAEGEASGPRGQAARTPRVERCSSTAGVSVGLPRNTSSSAREVSRRRRSHSWPIMVHPAAAFFFFFLFLKDRKSTRLNSSH